MYIDNFQFADLKQNTVPYIAVMHFGAWLLFLRKEKDYVAYCCYVHSASIFPASWMNRRFFVPKTVGKYKRLDVGHQ